MVMIMRSDSNLSRVWRPVEDEVECVRVSVHVCLPTRDKVRKAPDLVLISEQVLQLLRAEDRELVPPHLLANLAELRSDGVAVAAEHLVDTHLGAVVHSVRGLVRGGAAGGHPALE